MDVMLVLDAFILLSGLTKEEAEPWLPLCHWAMAALYGKLHPDVDLPKNRNLLAYTAGTMAYYKYTLRNAAKERAASFSAGDVKVTEDAGQSVQAAKELYEAALQSAEHLLGTEDFLFMGVV